VRTTYAQCLAPLAAAAHRFLVRAQHLDLQQQQQQQQQQQLQHAGGVGPGRPPGTTSYDADLKALRGVLRQVVIEYLTPADQQAKASVAGRCAILVDAGRLCQFFGLKEANDFLLPQLITCLNDPSWHLRAAFFEHIPRVRLGVGCVALEAFLLPCVEQALMDAQEFVVARAVRKTPPLGFRVLGFLGF